MMAVVDNSDDCGRRQRRMTKATADDDSGG
jgi:hypothetical protein